MADSKIIEVTAAPNESVLKKADSNEFSDISRVGENVLSASALFGQSEEETEIEYKTFKAQKIFKRIEMDATDVSGDDNINHVAESCLKYGFGGIVVLPQYISVAEKKLKGSAVKVIGAVSFPYGEEIPYTTVKSAKKAATKGADTVLVPVGVALIKRGMTDVIKQTFKKIIKKTKVNVCACLECSSLTQEEVEKTVKALTLVGVTSFRSSTGAKGDSDEFTHLKDMRSAFKSGHDVTAYTETGGVYTALRLLTVADKLATKKATEIANEIKTKLKLL